MIKKPPEGDAGDKSLIPGWRISPREENGNLLQYSCLENSMDRGAWWATAHGVEKRGTRLSAHTHTHTHTQTPIPRTRLWAHRTVYGIVPTPKSNQPHWRGILLYLFIYLAFCFNILSVSALSFYMQSSP